MGLSLSTVEFTKTIQRVYHKITRGSETANIWSSFEWEITARFVSTLYWLSSPTLILYSYMKEIPTPNGWVPIPSEYDRVGVTAAAFPPDCPELWNSWSYLGSFTRQTISNFQKCDSRGVLYVHSVEDIMGVREAIAELWKWKFPQGSKKHKIALSNLKQDEICRRFHEIFTPDEFLELYPELLAQRPLISGSVIHCGITKNSNTFGPVSLILDVPAECIWLTSKTDAFTPVRYMNMYRTKSIHRECRDFFNRLMLPENVVDVYLQMPSLEYTLDHMIRYPVGDRMFRMNEVSVRSCVKDDVGKEYRPKIIGVFLNNPIGFSANYGLNARSATWKQAIRTFAKKRN